MHETGIAIDLHRMCRERIPGGEPARLDRVRVAIGDRSSVEPDLLGFAWAAVTAGTPDEGSKLEVDACATRQTCARCGVVRDRAGDGWLRRCPHCGDPLRLEGGDELDLIEFAYSTRPAPQEELA